MSKRLPNVNAKPFEEALGIVAPKLMKFLLDTNTETDARGVFNFNPIEGRDELAETLKTMVNADICLTNFQENELSADMLNYFKNPDRTKLLAIVAVINSYRNECANCLTSACGKRDTDFPVEAIQ